LGSTIYLVMRKLDGNWRISKAHLISALATAPQIGSSIPLSRNN